MKRPWMIIGSLFLLAAPLWGQRDPTSAIDYDTAWMDRNLTAVRIDGEITLDGVLDEPAWELAEPATDFVQWQPSTGQPSAERTEVYVLYDDDSLYLGFVGFDSRPDQMRVNDLREDFTFSGTDSIGIVIDSLNDNRSGFLFGTNPAGAKRDSQLSNDSTFNDDWDGVWDVRVARNDQGFVAEFVIPFKTLRFSKSPTQEWGLNVNRRILRLNEESSWSPYPVRYRISRISMAGTLGGLENVRQGRNLKVKPYLTAGFGESRDREPRWDDTYDGGVDVKYGLTPSLTLDATYNTDFAQVEADQQQVNLTRFSLFFPEKREFFLENSATFAFGGGGGGGGPLIPFFSRRIGLSARGTPTPIVGGARVSGQLGRYDVGFLAMRTDELDPSEDANLDPRDLTPANTYVVGRVKRNLMTNSWIGAIMTDKRSAVDLDSNRVLGADARFQFFNRLNLGSYLLRSWTPGIRGDDQARQFDVSWDDDEVALSAGYLTIQPNFKPEVGFVRRENMTQYEGEASWNPLIESSDAIRNFRFETGLQYIQGASSGEIETRDHRMTTGIQFQNSSSVAFTTRETFERLIETFEIRTGIPIPVGDYSAREYSFSASGDPSWKLSPRGSANWGEFWNGDRTSYGAGLSLKPHFRWSLDLDYSRNRVTLPPGEFTTDLLGARFVYGFSPYAFFNAFVQYNADTNRVSSNFRFNWTHSPLSDLYIVYNETRDSDRGELADRAIIVKLTNLFDF
jgi:hypothetical protein